MTSEIILSADQADALDNIRGWYHSEWSVHNGKLYLTLGGFAGTGKTTLLGQLQSLVFPGKRIHYCSYTGKAVSVLASKLPLGSMVTTLHRLLYHPQPHTVCKVSKEPCIPGYACQTHAGPIVDKYAGKSPAELAAMFDKNGPEKGCETVKQLDWSAKQNPLDDIDLVVVDEASMVSEKIWSDLTRWGVPVLAVGDHGQLPPIKSEFNLMSNPDIRLETILRQVAGSPIIRMATMARLYGEIPMRHFGEGCVKITRRQMHRYEMDPDSGDLVIVGYNRTRNELNEQFRKLLDRSGPPQPGDIVICLRNSYEHGIFNGMRGRVREFEIAGPDTAFAVIEMLDEGFDFTGEVSLTQFGLPKTDNTIPRHLSLFDYGYAMTCHKAQGSQADRVMVVEERLPQTDHKRWLYTAVTRAAKELIVVGR